MKARFSVDWSDHNYPKIFRLPEGDYRTHDGTGQTFSEAKEEIRTHFTVMMEYARGQLQDLRKLRAANVPEEERA